MGIFDEGSDLYVFYHGRIEFRDKIMGGTPGDPKLVEGWLKKNLADETTKEELKRRALRTMLERNGEDADWVSDVPEGELDTHLDEVVERLASTRQSSGFKRDENGIYVESRHVKAMLRESVNILFAGSRWGKTNKGPKNFFVERVFVDPARIHLGQPEADGVELFVGHVSGPGGPRSTLTYYEYVERGAIDFTVRLTRAADKEIEDCWPEIWVLSQDKGLGALRSQDHGKFDLTKWERSDVPHGEIDEKASLAAD